MAIMDVEVMKTDEKKRENIFREIISKEGPPDGTVIISLPGEAEWDDESMSDVLAVLGDVGEIVLVR